MRNKKIMSIEKLLGKQPQEISLANLLLKEFGLLPNQKKQRQTHQIITFFR